MGKIKILLILAVLGLIVFAAWQVGAAVIANMSFQEDIRDLAAQAGTHVGFVIPRSDEQVTQVMIQKAAERGIELAPAQITVRRTQNGELSTWYLAADYTVPVSLGISSFRLHFTPSSDRSGI